MPRGPLNRWAPGDRRLLEEEHEPGLRCALGFDEWIELAPDDGDEEPIDLEAAFSKRLGGPALRPNMRWPKTPRLQRAYLAVADQRPPSARRVQWWRERQERDWLVLDRVGEPRDEEGEADEQEAEPEEPEEQEEERREEQPQHGVVTLWTVAPEPGDHKAKPIRLYLKRMAIAFARGGEPEGARPRAG